MLHQHVLNQKQLKMFQLHSCQMVQLQINVLDQVLYVVQKVQLNVAVHVYLLQTKLQKVQLNMDINMLQLQLNVDVQLNVLKGVLKQVRNQRQNQRQNQKTQFNVLRKRRWDGQ